MKKHKCYFCEIENSKVNIHHINGKGLNVDITERDNRKENLIYLCSNCHDKIEAICSKCTDRKYCNINKFRECWIFEDAIPPKYFRTRKQAVIESFLFNDNYEPKCPKCYSKDIIRISIWRYEGVYTGKPSFRAIYKCKKCNDKFQRKLESYLERSNDNKIIPIEIENYSSYEDALLI